MKTRLHRMLVLLVMLGCACEAGAQIARLFRIAGPAATTISALRPDGTMVWSNAQPGATYIVQTATTVSLGSNWVNYVQLAVTSTVSTNLLFVLNPPAGMAFVPSGIFTMGDTLDGESDAAPSNTTVSAFYMDTNLVSYAQWQAVYNFATNHGYGFVNAGAGKGTNHPVQSVDWFDAVKWCNARSLQAGLTPVYYLNTNFTQIYTNGETAPFANWSANGFRLPTEAEWEKAARGGLIGQRFPWGDIISETQANYYSYPYSFSYDLGPEGYNDTFNDGVFPYTNPTGYFEANGYGLSDMAGNVSEWCWDWFGTPYAGGTDPRGPASGSYRVTRGGNWDELANGLTCANRHYLGPGVEFDVYGFRTVRGL